MIKKPTHVDTVINHISTECVDVHIYNIMFQLCTQNVSGGILRPRWRKGLRSRCLGPVTERVVGRGEPVSQDKMKLSEPKC